MHGSILKYNPDNYYFKECKMKTRFLSIILIVIIVLSITGCDRVDHISVIELTKMAQPTAATVLSENIGVQRLSLTNQPVNNEESEIEVKELRFGDTAIQ